MSRIGATIAGFEQYLLTQLSRAHQSSLGSTIRLTTGKNYNFPKDDPSAFFQVSSFERQLSVARDLKANIDVAASVGAESQITLDEMRTQLETIRETLLLDEDGTLTVAERSENQTLVDDAIRTIRTLARTSINGKRYLDGTHDYTFTGKDSSQIKKINVHSLSDDAIIAGTVTTAATQTSRTYTGAGARVSGNATFVLTGKRGSTTISVTNNEELTAARDRINADSHDTGITASVAGNDLIFTTVDYGASATIDIDITSGTFTTASTTVGADAVVTINGQSISSSSVDGNVVSYIASGVNVGIEFQPGYTGTFSSVTVSDDTVSRFALSTRSGDWTKFSLPSLFPEVLGGVSGELSDLESGGTLAGLGSNTQAAIRVVDEALEQLTGIESRVASFADITVASAGRLMDGFISELESSVDAINEVDEDREELLLAKNESRAANAAAAMSILQQQQGYVLSLLQMLAGGRD